jgi:hypothetical protein
VWMEALYFHQITLPAFFVKINWPHLCGFISGISVLSHQSVYLFSRDSVLSLK